MMKRLMVIIAACVLCMAAQAEDLKIDWSIESGYSTDWASIIAQVESERPIMLAVATSEDVVGATVLPAPDDLTGAGVDLAASPKEHKSFFKQNWGKILFSAIVAGRVAYHNRDKLGLGGSDSGTPSSASASFNQANTDNTRSQCDFRGATVGDGATIDCHDSSSRQ